MQTPRTSDSGKAASRTDVNSYLIGMAIGMVLGVPIGVALGILPVGIAIGSGVGVAIGAALAKHNSDEATPASRSSITLWRIGICLTALGALGATLTFIYLIVR